MRTLCSKLSYIISKLQINPKGIKTFEYIFTLHDPITNKRKLKFKSSN